MLPNMMAETNYMPFRYATADWSESSAAADMDLRLYAVTDAGQNERCQRSNAEVIEAAIQGGATFIQLREKDAPGGIMLREAQASLEVCQRHGVGHHLHPSCFLFLGKCGKWGTGTALLTDVCQLVLQCIRLRARLDQLCILKFYNVKHPPR